MIVSRLRGLSGAASAWKSRSTNRRILGAALVVGVMTVAVRVGGMLKELLVAWRFGRSDELEAFLVAFTVPSLVVSVIAGSIGPALIPTFVRVRDTRGVAAAQRLYAGVAFWSVGLLVVATAAMVGAAPFYLRGLASGFGADKQALAERLLYAMAPLILFNGLAAVSGAILNAGERFALPALTPLLPAAGAAVGALVGAGVGGAFAMAFGLVAGHFLEALMLIGAVARSGFPLRFVRPRLDPEARHVLGQYLPMVGGSLLMVSTQVVDQAMAAMLPAGSVAALNYGNKIMGVPLNVAVTALGTAVIPYLSVLVARRDWDGVHRSVAKYLRVVFAAAVPATVALVVGATPLVRLFFERGAFTAADTRVVAAVQALASLQIPFYVAGILVVRAISSLSANRILLYGNVVNVTVNVALNWFFMRSIGVAGIALSTSVMYLVSFLYLYFSYCQRRARLRAEDAA